MQAVEHLFADARKPEITSQGCLSSQIDIDRIVLKNTAPPLPIGKCLQQLLNKKK